MTNEQNAAAWMQQLAQAQRLAIELPVSDPNGDGIGQPLFLAELLGVCTLRGTKDFIPEDLRVSESFEAFDRGFVTASGYHFQVHLGASAGSAWVSDVDSGGAGGATLVDDVEWRCYAWPVEFGDTGRRAFFVDESGAVRASLNERTRYSGRSRVPKPGAALGEMPWLHPDDAYLGKDGDWWNQYLELTSSAGPSEADLPQPPK